MFVGARFAQAGDLERAGAVYVFEKHGSAWKYEDKIVSPAPEDEDNFGRAVAVEGSRMVVTARKSSLEEGSAYVFEKKGGKWVHKADIVAGDAAPGAYFGQSVDMQGDLIVIGARNAEPERSRCGCFLPEIHGTAGREIAKVIPEDGKKNDQFGFAVDISGNVVAVGARRADPEFPERMLVQCMSTR